MVKFLVLLLTILSSFFLLPKAVHAHLGGGPPFLRIDGKFANTNTLNQGASVMQIGWDVPPERYLVNTPVNFEVDLPVLMAATTVPQEYVKDIKVRWSFATGDNFEKKDTAYEEGAKITKTFSKPGSYLVIIEAKLPADSDYIVVDTVQVDILPDKNYQLPSPYVYIGTQFDDPKKHVLMVSDSSADSSTSLKAFLWDMGDGNMQNGKSMNRRLEKAEATGVQPIFHRIVDANGFVADIGFVAESMDDKLRFIPFNSNSKLAVTVGTYQEASKRAGTGVNKLSVPAFIGVSLGVILAIGAGWWFALRNRK